MESKLVGNQNETIIYMYEKLCNAHTHFIYNIVNIFRSINGSVHVLLEDKYLKISQL